MLALAPMIPEVFQEDTHKFTLKTKAREGIWTSKADFQAKADDLAKAMVEVAVRGDSEGHSIVLENRDIRAIVKSL